MLKNIFDKYVEINYIKTEICGITLDEIHPGFIPIRINAKKIPTDLEWNTRPPQVEYDEHQLYGMMPPTNILAVDVDVKNNQPGLASWKKFLNDNYPVELHKEFESPNVITPSGGFHFYITLENDNYLKIPKTHPNYPGIDFITHGKAQVVAGGQVLDNGEYKFINIAPKSTLTSLECFTLTNTLQEKDRASVSILDIKKDYSSPFSSDTIRKFLTFIPSDEYEIWYKVGFMLIDSNIHEQEAKSIWHEWSERSDKYEFETAEKRWNQLKSTNTRKNKEHITIASLPFFARQCSPEHIEEINEICIQNAGNLEKQFALIEVKKKSAIPYYDLKKKTFVSSEYISRELYPYMERIKKIYNLKKEPNLQMLTKLGYIRILHAETYLPQMSSQIVKYKGLDCLNTYNIDNVPKALPIGETLTESTQFFIDHIQRIYGEYTTDFLSFIAYLTQHPGKKIRYMMVLQGGHGTGKGLIMQAIKNHILGWDNCRTVDNSTIVDNYNNLFFNKQLIIIEELKVEYHRSEIVMNQLKTLITEPTAVCKEKYQTAVELPNVASFIALTNYKNCLKNADKRRYHAIISPIQDPKELEKMTGITTREYFQKLAFIASQGNPDGGELRSFFLNYQIPESFSPDERPFKSDFEKIEKENLDNNEKWSDYIDLIRHVYNTEILPDYIDNEILIAKSKDNNPDTNLPFFDPGEVLTPKMLKKFGRSFGYKLYFRCLFSNKLNEDEAKKYIMKCRRDRTRP